VLCLAFDELDILVEIADCSMFDSMRKTVHVCYPKMTDWPFVQEFDNFSVIRNVSSVERGKYRQPIIR